VTALVIQAIATGLGFGAVYSVIALGYTLILGSSGVFNFAQGSAVMGGALVTYGVGTVVHWPILAMVGVVVLSGVVAGLISHTIAVLPLTMRAGVASLTFGTFLSTLGLGLALNSIIGLTFGTATTATVHFYVTQNPIVIGAAHIRPLYVVMLAVTVAVVVLFEVVQRRTSAGLVMRAVFNDVEGAAISGVSITQVVRIVFVVGCILAAVAGMLIVPITGANTQIANKYAFFGFAAMAIGGYGSFIGAVAGGLAVGLIQFVPSIWVNPDWSNALIYGLLLLVLLLKPQGLFGSGGSAFGAAGLREV
jgi:branched-subunit amino acid ABC-type transport system permease component